MTCSLSCEWFIILLLTDSLIGYYNITYFCSFFNTVSFSSLGILLIIKQFWITGVSAQEFTVL